MDQVGFTQRLQKIVLSWDYFDLCRKVEERGGLFESIRSVPPTFTSIKEYKEVFEPLLLEECCAQILRGVDEGQVLTPHPAVVSTHEYKDDFMCVRTVLQLSCHEEYWDNDLVLLCKENPESETATGELHALGYCEAHEGEQSVRIKFYLTDESQAGNTAGTMRVRAMRTGLESSGSCWWLLKLSNMSTITREWVGMHHAHLCPFISCLLSGKPKQTTVATEHMDIPAGMKTTMEATCNSSQMKALAAGLDGSSMVLIQGPPGTGKTRTILNLLSVVMHSARKADLALESRGAAGAPNGVVLDFSGISEEERDGLWRAQAPWLFGETNPRDTTPKDIPSTSTDCFGLLQQVKVHRVSRRVGARARVLVCAPSNSALDEIVLRIIKSGLMDKDGNQYVPTVVRVGANYHHSVASVSLDAILDARLGTASAAAEAAKTSKGKRGGPHGPGAGGVAYAERDRLKLAILEEASIVCTTLNFAGSSIFYRLTRRFDVVVIDEAAQAVEPSLMVPLVMGCKQAYLVGDPVQLPATVLSSRALEHGYDTSLFKRLQVAGYPVHVLNVQYRMNPEISRFPSHEFYGGQLLDAESVSRESVGAWHAHRVFGPLTFFDVAGYEQSPPNGASMMNKTEANMVLSIYRELLHRYPVLRGSSSVAVISPYKAQVNLLRDLLRTALGDEGAALVDVNTVDGFQGREKDIALFSCVRSRRKVDNKPPKSIGFVADERRINVGLTRARCSLLIVGNARALQVDPHWANLIHDALTRGLLYRPQPPFSDWLTSALAGEIGPVIPTKQELEALDKVRSKLSHHEKVSEDELAGAAIEEDLELGSSNVEEAQNGAVNEADAFAGLKRKAAEESLEASELKRVKH